MVRKGSQKRKQAKSQEELDPYGLNEVDDFASKKERVLLEQSTLGDRRHVSDDDDLGDDEEEEVLHVSDTDDSDESESEYEQQEEEQDLDGAEAYRKVFGRKLDLDQPVEDEEGGMLGNEEAWGSKGEYYGACLLYTSRCV